MPNGRWIAEPMSVLILIVLVLSLLSSGTSYRIARPAGIVVDVPPPQPSGSISAPPAMPIRILLDVSGRGNLQTSNFTAAGTWQLQSTFDCSTLGGSRRFAVELIEADGDDVGMLIDVRGSKGNPFAIQPRQDTFSLQVISPCAWHVMVEGPPG